jgi:hypothetical protein
LDISDKTTHICAVDGDGKIVWRGVCATDPEASAMMLQELQCQFTRHGNPETAASEKDSRSTPEVVSESVDLVHPLMQDGHDADVAVRKQLPIDEMLLMATDGAVLDSESIHPPERCRPRPITVSASSGR